MDQQWFILTRRVAESRSLVAFTGLPGSCLSPAAEGRWRTDSLNARLPLSIGEYRNHFRDGRRLVVML